MKHTTRLSPEDWIMAGFRALTAGGSQAIRAEAIARDLGVSKGSFYWHFKDVPALKRAMLDHWADIATKQIITTVEYNRKEASEQLRLLVRIATSENNAPYGGKMVEAAIRDWARYDPDAADTLGTVNRQRLAFLTKLFEQNGAPHERSAQLANLLYAALIGLEQLDHHGMVEAQHDLPALLEILLRADEG